MPQKLSFTSLSTFLVLIIVLVSCDTKVDLLAPYKASPVIVAVLDASATDQYIRINKTYMGEGNLNSYAAIKDSIEYAEGEVVAKIIKVNNGLEVQSWTLEPVEIDMRDEGLFYDTDVKFYHMAGELLTEEEKNSTSATADITFKLEATIRGETYSAETQAITISNSNVKQTNLQLPNIDAPFMNGNSYSQIIMTFEGLMNIGRMEAKIRTHFDYDLEDGTKVTGQYFDFSLGTQDVQGTQVEFENNSEGYYETAGDVFEAIENVKKIRLDSIEYIGYAANEDLSTYINVANPVSDLVQVQTEFSNIDGAIGIFAFRTAIKFPKHLNNSSIEQFNIGQYTGFACYCTNWPTDLYYCTSSTTACP